MPGTDSPCVYIFVPKEKYISIQKINMLSKYALKYIWLDSRPQQTISEAGLLDEADDSD